MYTHFHISDKDSVIVYPKTDEGEKCFKIAIQVGGKLANGMHETLIHYKDFSSAAEANRLAVMIEDIGQVDLANYTWTPARAFEGLPSRATPNP